jgi:hypothetical protein
MNKQNFRYITANALRILGICKLALPNKFDFWEVVDKLVESDSLGLTSAGRVCSNGSGFKLENL